MFYLFVLCRLLLLNIHNIIHTHTHHKRTTNNYLLIIITDHQRVREESKPVTGLKACENMAEVAEQTHPKTHS